MRKQVIQRSAEEREIESALKSKKAGRGALCYYKNNLWKAIADAFPEIGVDVYLLLFVSLLTICLDNSNGPKNTSTYVHSILNIAYLLYSQEIIGVMLTTEENISLSLRRKRDVILWWL